MNYTKQTAEYLSGLDDMRYARLVIAADSMGRGLGTVSKALAKEGSSFIELLDNERMGRITQAIDKDPDTILKQLAGVCGLANERCVGIMIKRVTGQYFVEFKQGVVGNMTASNVQA